MSKGYSKDAKEQGQGHMGHTRRECSIIWGVSMFVRGWGGRGGVGGGRMQFVCVLAW